MNSSPLSPAVTSYATLQENRYLLLLKVRRNTVALNSYLGLFVPCRKKKKWFTYNVDKGGNSLHKHFERNPNIRLNLLITLLSGSQIQNEVGRFFYNLAEFVFEYFCDSRRILASFAKFFPNGFYCSNMIVLLPKWSPRSRSTPSPSYTCIFFKIFAKSFPSSHGYYRGISLKRFKY